MHYYGALEIGGEPMKLIKNMTLLELERELSQEEATHARILSQIDAIHGKKDHSDEVVKYFHLGMVGFRTDRKRVNQTLNRTLDNAAKACDLYAKRDDAAFRIQALNKAIAYIRSEPEMSDMTASQIKAAKRQKALDAAPALKWERKDGGYSCGAAFVKKIDSDFVVIEIAGKRLERWYRTVKEAKAVAAILLEMGKTTQGPEPSGEVEG